MTSVEQRLVDALVQSSFTTMAILTRVAAVHDLSLTQLRVLAILADHEVTITELARHLGLDKSTVSGLVDRAEKRGLVRRSPDDADRRVVRVTASPEGVRFAAAATRQVAQALRPSTAQLSATEQARLADLLVKGLTASSLRNPHTS